MDISVVIPTVEEKDEAVTTLESVPEGVTTYVQRETPVTRARNAGGERGDSEYILFMDDDIVFDEETFWEVCSLIDDDNVVGLRDWDFGLIVTRVMGIKRGVWEDIGGLDERLGSHMEDTEFALRAARKGYRVETIPRDTVEHIEHGRSVSTWDRAWRLAYLAVKYPTSAPRLIRGVL